MGEGLAGSPAGPLRRNLIGTIVDYLPRGNTLSDEVFRRRHLLLCWILALHVPSLYVFGVWQGYGLGHSAVEVAVPAACLAFARLARNRRLASFFSTAGLVFCSYVLVHLSGGTIEAHFHFFILIGLIALYQDWVPFLWNVVFTVMSHGIGNTIAADIMYNHTAAQNQPWTWAVIHGVAVLAACVGVVIFWKNTELEQERSKHLATELTEAELAAVKAEAERRQSVSDLFVNLARRNQSLLDRQLGLIAELEQREQSPDSLSELFQLDHLATRIRRNAESLLVLSGDEPARRWGRPVPLGEVVRAAAAEVEDYQRVEVLVNSHLEVEGRAVADMAHLLAELIENATSFSPPSSEVRVRSHPTFDQGASYVLSIEDTGIGMAPAALQAANEILAQPPEIDVRRSTLGLHVVSRLAKRYGLRVRLGPTPGGGVTALVTLSDDLVSERRRTAPIDPVALEPVGAGAGARIGNGQARPRDAVAGASAVHAVPDVPEIAPLTPLTPLPASASVPALEAASDRAATPSAADPGTAPSSEARPAPTSDPVPAPPPASEASLALPPAPAPGSEPASTTASTASATPPDPGTPLRHPVAPPPPPPPPPPGPGRRAVVMGPDGRDLTPPRLWADSWHLTTPTGAPAPADPPAPASGTDGALPAPAEGRHEPAPPQPPASNGAPAPAEPRTADGLVRRVPGAGLASPNGGAGSEASAPPEPPHTPPSRAADGLARRVPGAGLARSETPEVAEPRSEPEGEPSAPPAAAQAPPPPRTADGLVRRVPGAGLAAGLRRTPGSSRGRGAAAPRVPRSRDRERMRSMLSRFQASQRAGRASLDAPPSNGQHQEDA